MTLPSFFIKINFTKIVMKKLNLHLLKRRSNRLKNAFSLLWFNFIQKLSYVKRRNRVITLSYGREQHSYTQRKSVFYWSWLQCNKYIYTARPDVKAIDLPSVNKLVLLPSSTCECVYMCSVNVHVRRMHVYVSERAYVCIRVCMCVWA